MGTISSEYFTPAGLFLIFNIIIFSISASALNTAIGYAVAVIITLGIVLLIITSLAAAFIPECPFDSPFSTIIKFIFEFLGKFLDKYFPRKAQKDNSDQGRLWLSIPLCVGTGAAIAYGTLEYSFNILALVFIPLAITFEYAMLEPKDKNLKDIGFHILR